MSVGRVSRCHSCQARIRWAILMPSERHMPLDADPAATGTIAFQSDNERARVLTKAEIAEAAGKVPLFISHFATCPQATKYRRQP